MTILHGREAGLQAAPPENGLSEVPAGCQVSRDLLQVLVRPLGFSMTAARRVDGVENRILVVHKVSDVWVSPGLERTLQRERTESSAVCNWQGHGPLVWLL